MQSRDDHLFEAQRKNRERKRRKLILTIAGAILVVILIVAAGVNVLKQKVNEQMGSSEEVLSAQVTVGNISTTVSGSGTLEAVDVENESLAVGTTYGDSVTVQDGNATSYGTWRIRRTAE